MKKLILASLLVLLTACATEPKPFELPTPKERKINIDERLLIPCKAPSDLLDNPKKSDVLRQNSEDKERHAECFRQNQQLIKAIRAAF